MISQAGEFIPSPAISSPPKLSSKTNKQPEKKNTAQVKRTAKPTQKDRTTATEHEHDTNDMSPTPLHSTTNHPRLGDPKMVWYQGGSGVGIVGVGDDIAGTEGLECA